jgi:hypothetical protein
MNSWKKVSQSPLSGAFKRFLYAALLLAIVLSPFLAFTEVSGQGRWSTPFRLSNSENLLVGMSAAMVADPYGNVHVFWIEERESEKRAIFYAGYDGTVWSQPVDLFESSSGLGIGDFLTVSIDKTGVLHLAWLAGTGGPVLFSSAYAGRASSVREWTTPQRIDAPAHRMRLIVDSKNVYHFVYTAFTTVRPGIYYKFSNDEGRQWSRPLWLNPDIPQGHEPDNMQSVIDDEDRLHVVWSQRDVATGSRGGAVLYTQTRDGGVTWAPLTALDAAESGWLLDNSDPSLAVEGDSVLVTWAAGTELLYRNYRLSTDGGLTWNNPVRKVFGELHGQAQGDGLTVDAAGRVHFVGHIRWPEGMYHAQWSDGDWSSANMFYLIRRNSEDDKLGVINAHGVRAVVRGGNQIVSTFYDRSDEQPDLPANALYATTYTLPGTDPAPAAPTATATSLIATPDEVLATPNSTSASPTPTRAWAAEDDVLTAGTASSTDLLTAGILPALFIILAVTVIRFVRREL